MINPYSPRRYIIAAIILLVSLTIIIRLFYLQVINQSYKFSAENNSQRFVTQYPARGLIYDRNRELLVYNQPAYDISIIPSQLEPFDTINLCNILEIPKNQFVKIKEDIKNRKDYNYHRPSILIEQISSETYLVKSFYNIQYKFYYA